MEWVRGETLEDLLRKGPVDLRQGLRIGAEIAEALAAAHDQNVVHRDIKPSNVVLSDRGVKVLDFGLAKVALATSLASESKDEPDLRSRGSELLHEDGLPTGLSLMNTVLQTQDGTLTGTVPYMSPEQARMEEVDHRTDLFSLAVVLYEMLAGERPFQGKTVFETLTKIVTCEPVPLSARIGGVPEAVQRILDRGMAKDRRDRYSSAAEMVDDLRHALEAPELEAGRPAGRAAGRLPGRRPLFLAAAGLMLVFGLGWWWLSSRARAREAAPAEAVLKVTRSEIRSLAVLPFELEQASGEPAEQDYLADGLTEELINRLSRLDELRVISRASVFRFKDRSDLDLAEIAGRLSADALVTGRVRNLGEQLVVSVELTVGEEHIWGQRFQRAAGDLYALQADMAATIAGRLVSRLSGSARRELSTRGTDDAEAYRLYLRGLFYWNRATREGVDESIRYFREALDRDPRFALAHAGLAMAYGLPLGESNVPPANALVNARISARRALELDPDLPQAHTALASAELWYGMDLGLAESGFRHAIALDSSNALAHHQLGWMLTFADRLEEARAELRLALELDPMSQVILTDSCLPDVVAAKEAPALVCLHDAQDTDPDFFLPYFVEGWLQLQLADPAAAQRAFEKALDRQRTLMVLGFLGNAVARQGDVKRARQLMEEIGSQNDTRFLTAVIQVGLGDHDAAFASLDAGFEERDSWMIWLPMDRVFDPLRSDPRWPGVVLRLRRPS